MVNDEIIGDVLDVLEFVLQDVVDLPGNIIEKVIDKLTIDVKDPLDKVIKLASGKYCTWISTVIGTF